MTQEEINRLLNQYGGGWDDTGTIPGFANNGYSIQYIDPTTGNSAGWGGAFIPLYGPLPAGVQEYSLPDHIKAARASVNAPPMNFTQMLNTPSTAPTAGGWTPSPPPPAPTSGSGGSTPSPFPPSMSWLPLLMNMMPPRPAPPRPISSIFNPSSFAPSTSAFPGGTSAFTPQPLDTSGMDVRADTDINAITRRAMESNENFGRQSAIQYGGTMQAPSSAQSLMFPSTSQQSFAPLASNNLSSPWLMTDLSRNSPSSRTGK